MKPIFAGLALCVLAGAVWPAAAGAQPAHDGTFFAHGTATDARSPRAAEALTQMEGLLGQWDVMITTYPTDTTSLTQPGQAVITYMNRGYGFMERFYSADFDGQGTALNTLWFLNVAPSSAWVLGTASSYTERIQLFSGAFEDEALVLRDADRPGGGVVLTHFRATFSDRQPDAFTFSVETSTDHGATWQPSVIKRYIRRPPSTAFMQGGSEYGTPAADLPPEARQFDFLTGNWSAANALTFPNGQTARWPANEKAGFVLGGHAVLEYIWYDVDPNLPDAATTLLRLYNRAERRWESLYFDNRGNTQLHFGGRMEGDRMVLTLFDTNRTAAFSHFIFYDIKPDHYRWYSEVTSDGGKTFRRAWEIEVTRK